MTYIEYLFIYQEYYTEILTMSWEVICYELLNYNFHKSKLPLFREFNFLKEHIYVNKATSLTCDIFH